MRHDARMHAAEKLGQTAVIDAFEVDPRRFAVLIHELAEVSPSGNVAEREAQRQLGNLLPRERARVYE